MTIAGWQVSCLVLLLVCLASFGVGYEPILYSTRGTHKRNAGHRVVRDSICDCTHRSVVVASQRHCGERVFGIGDISCSTVSVLVGHRNEPPAAALGDIFAGPPAHLMTTGPYRVVRHPFYCSYLLVWLAGLVATAKWWLALTVAIMVAIYLRAARFEERKFLDSALARHYRDYQARTGQLVPNPWKVLAAGKEGFSS